MLESIQVVLSKGAAMPERATEGSSGFDLRAYIDKPIELLPLERRLIPTGIRLSMPNGYEAQVRPRSGLAYKSGITVLNTPGTIDADYTGDIGVILVNLSQQSFTIEPGARIAQLVFQKIEVPKLYEVENIAVTQRGDSGFGSTGTR
jgi:dUTP pyrophosphatase